MVKSSPQLVNEGSSSFLRAARAGNLEKVIEYLNGSLDINTANMNGMNALHLASKEGHTDMVKELLKRGANVNAGTNKGNTALHIASLGGKLQVVEILVDNGANVNAKSLNGFTPLYMAAQENHDAVVRYLLAHGANQSLATEDGFTPLAVALQQGHDKVVSILLENDAKGKVRLPALHIAAKKDDCKAAALLLQSDQKPDVTSKSGFTPLHIAAHYGNESIATLLLDKGANINFTAKHKITPLHVAAKWGKGNMVGLLLERGAQIEAATRDGLTPLHCAARSGHEPVVDLLLRRGAPYSAKTKNGLAPLHMASQGDHIDSARTLLAYKAPVDDVTVDYLTPLHVAAHCGHVKVAKLLLDHKADVNAQALNGFVPLHIACKKNRLKVVELLLKHGASIEVKTESGLTPLHVASFMGCTNIVLFLIQHGANVNKSTIRGETPIHLAARAGQAEIIPILVRNGAQVDARAREDQTALHIASRLGDVEIVQLLLSRGASIDAATKDQYTALHIAAKEGKENVADALLEQGASLTATTKKGFTPLHLAAKYGQFKVAKLLLEKDAPVDAQGKNGVTPLHVAAHYDHVQVALLLLEKKASPHATAKNGYTPLHIAAKKKQMEIATTLLEYGAKANAESKAGFTPLHLAAQEGHTDMGELLISHKANVNAKSKLELTPLHLSAQSDKVAVAQVLLRNRADVNAQTKQGYTPLHVACHNGAINMIKLLIQAGANVDVTTQHGYTPLHQAAQQGHTLVINLLLDHKASPNKTTNLGYTPLAIAQKCNYISVVETLKTVTEVTTTSIITTTTGEKYSYNNPETMQETFMTTDSEDEGGEGADNWAKVNLNYEKNDGNEYNKHDESFGFDVTHDESGSRAGDLSAHAPLTVDESISPSHIIMQESIINNFTPDNIDISRPPTSVGRLKWKTFLVSFMVDARGGAMRGCRHSGVRIIIPPRKAPMPMRITCRYLKKEKLIHPPPLMEGEACASRILEVGPSGAKFLGPVIIEVPHFASMRGREREIIILRSDDGENWKEHTLEASEEAVRDILNESFQGDSDLNALEPEFASDRITRILTTDFPQYFAIITRIRQEVNAMGPEGGMVNSSVVPQVQAIFPAGALTKKIKVGLQAQPIASELVAKMLGNRVAVSPIVTVEPRRRKFHKPITLTIPVPQAATRGMINSYTGDTPTLRLLCSITGSTKSGGTSKAQWEDVTGSTPLSFVNNCVSFTTTVSARFWLMDCRQVNEATKFATDLYREATAVPFMSKFVVFAKRHDPAEAQMRIFCMTDDKEDKTLEHQEQFTETAKSRDVEVLEGKPQYLEFAGNLVPVTKSGEQLNLTFHAFRENRLPFLIRVRDSSQEPFGKIAFMKEPRKTRGEPPQVPICNLNIKLPDTIVEEEPVNNPNDVQIIRETIQRSAIDDDIILNADPSIMQMGQDLAKDWIKVASHLDLDPGDTEKIKKQFANQESEQATAMLYSVNLKKSLFNNKDLCKALWDIGRKDLVTKYYPNHSQYLAEFGIKLNGKLDDASELIKSSKGLPTEREVAFDDKDIMKDAESMEESEGESVGVNLPTSVANNKVSLQEAKGQEDEERATAVKQYLKYLEDEDREDSEERAAYRGEKSTPNELYIIKEEIQVPTGDPVIDTSDGDKSSILEPTYEAESQIKTEEKVEFTDEGGLTHSITQVTKTTIIQEVEDPIQASVQHRLQQQPQTQQQQQLLESGKPYESETWQSGEQDTSQVSVSSLPEDEKSEPTTATVSSATTTTTNASDNAVSSRIASVTEEPGTKITVEQNGNSDKEEYQLIAESILRQVYDEVFELIRTKKITIDDKEWFETEASGDVVHIIEQSTTCERNEDKSVKEESDHEMSYTEKKDYFAKLSHDSTVKPVPPTPHYCRSSSIETSGMNKSETRRPSEGEIVETVGGFQERRAYFESTGRRSFSIDTASMEEARTAYNTSLIQRSSQHPDSGLKEEDEQDDNIKGNLNLLHDYGGNLGCNVSHVDVRSDEFNESASNLQYMSKDELYEALNQLEAEIELAQSDLDRVDKENDEETMSQLTLDSSANEAAPNYLKINDKLVIGALNLHELSPEEPHSNLVNDDDLFSRSSSALGSSSMRLIVRNRTDVSVKDFPANEVDVETGEIARLLVRPISRSNVETTDNETANLNESVVYKVWKGLDPIERCPSPLRQQFSRALRDIEPSADPDDCVSGKSRNPDTIKGDKVATLNQQITIVKPHYLSNWKSMKNILTDEGLDLISQAIEIALIQIPSETGYPKYYFIARELIKSLVEASLERVLFYAIEMVRVDCVESGLINLTSPSIPGLSSVPIPYWLPHTHDSSTFPNPNNLTKDTWFRLVDVRSVATQTAFRTNQISRWIQTNVSYLNPSWNGYEPIHRFGSPGVDSIQSGGIEWSGKGSGRRRPSVSTFRDSIDDDSYPMSVDYRISSWAADRATQTTSEGDLFSEEYFDVDDMDVDSLKSEIGSVYGEDSSDEMSSSERQRYEDLIAANEAIETGLMALVAGELALLAAEAANEEINEVSGSDSSSVPPCILYKGNDIPWLDDEGWDSDEQRYTCNGKPNSLSVRRDSRSHGSDTSNDCLDNRLSDDDGDKEGADKSDDRNYKLYDKQSAKRTFRSSSKRSSSSEGSVASIGSQTCEHEFETKPKYLETDLDSVEIIEGKISLAGEQGSSAFTKVKSIDKDSYLSDLVNVGHLTEESVDDEYEDKFLLRDSISGYLENEDDEDDLVYELGTILSSDNAVSNTHFNDDKLTELQSVNYVQEASMNFELESCEAPMKMQQTTDRNDNSNDSSEISSRVVTRGFDLVSDHDSEPYKNESDNEETESQSEYEPAYLDDDQEQHDSRVNVDLDVHECEENGINVFQYPSYIIAESPVSYIGDSSEDIPSEEQNYDWILSQYGSPSVQKRFGVHSNKPESSKYVVDEVDSFAEMTSQQEKKQTLEISESFYEESSSNSSLENDNYQISGQSSVLIETPKSPDKYAREFVPFQEYDENNNLILNEQETDNNNDQMLEDVSYGQNYEVLDSNEESIERVELNEELNFEELDAEISQTISSYDNYALKGIEQNFNSDWYDYDQERCNQNRFDFDHEIEADSSSKYCENYLRKQSLEDIEPDYEEYMNEIEMKNETATYASRVLGAIKDKIATLLNRPMILDDELANDDISDSSLAQLDDNNNIIDEHELMEKMSSSFETTSKIESKDNLERKLELVARKDLIDMSNANYPQTVECLMMNLEEAESSSSQAQSKPDFVEINSEDEYDKVRESNVGTVHFYNNLSQTLEKSSEDSDCLPSALQKQDPSTEIMNISSESGNEMVKSIDSDSSLVDSGLMLSSNTSTMNTQSSTVDFNSAQMSSFVTETDVVCSPLDELSKSCENRHENAAELDVDSDRLSHVTYDEVVAARKDSSESVTVDGLGPSGSEYDTATTDQSSSSYKTAIPFSSDENSFATIQSSTSLESINSIESDKSIIQTESVPSLLESKIENTAENLLNEELFDELPIELIKDPSQHGVSTLPPLAEEMLEDSDDDINNECDELTYSVDEMIKDETEETKCILSEADRLKARLLEILNRPTVLPESRLEEEEVTELSDSVSDQVSLCQGVEDEFENESLSSEKVSIQDDFEVNDDVQIIGENDKENEFEFVDELNARYISELLKDQVDVSQVIAYQNKDLASKMIESSENLAEQISSIDDVNRSYKSDSISESSNKNEMSNLIDETQIVDENDNKDEFIDANAQDESELLRDQVDVSQVIESTKDLEEDSVSKEQACIIEAVSPQNESSAISESSQINEMPLLSSNEAQIVGENDFKNKTVEEAENSRDVTDLAIDRIDVAQEIEVTVQQKDDSTSTTIETDENLKRETQLIDAINLVNELSSVSETPSTGEMTLASDVEAVQSFSKTEQIEASGTTEQVQNELESVLVVEKAEVCTQQSNLGEVCETLVPNVREDLFNFIQEPTIELENELIASELDEKVEETNHPESLELNSATIKESPVVMDIHESEINTSNDAVYAKVSDVNCLPKAASSSVAIQEDNENESLDELKVSCINEQIVGEKVSENENYKFAETDKEKDDIPCESNLPVQSELEPQISEPFYPDSELAQLINFETIAQSNSISEFKDCQRDEMSETIELIDIQADKSSLEFIRILESEQQISNEIQDPKCEKQMIVEDSLPVNDTKLSEVESSNESNSSINNEKENEFTEVFSSAFEVEKLVCQTHAQLEKYEKEVKDITLSNTFENESETKTESKHVLLPQIEFEEEITACSDSESHPLDSEPIRVISNSLNIDDEMELIASQSEIIVYKLQEIEEEKTITDSRDQVLSILQEDQPKLGQTSEKTELVEPQNPIKIEYELENLRETIEQNINADSNVNAECERVFCTELRQADAITTVNAGEESNSIESNVSLYHDGKDDVKFPDVQTNEPKNSKKEENQSDLSAISSGIVNKPEEMNLIDEERMNETLSEQSVDKPKKPERKKKITKPKIEIAQSKAQEELLSPILDADHEAEIIENTFKNEMVSNQIQSIKSEEVKDEFDSKSSESEFIEKSEMKAKKVKAELDFNNRDSSLGKEEKLELKAVDNNTLSQKDETKVEFSEKQVDDSNVIKVEKVKDTVEDIKAPKDIIAVNAESKIVVEAKNNNISEKQTSDESEVRKVSKQKLAKDSKVNVKKESKTKDKESVIIMLNNETIQTLDSILFVDAELILSLDINECKNIDKSEIVANDRVKSSQVKVSLVESRVRSDLLEQTIETTEILTTDNSEKAVLDKIDIQRSTATGSINIEVQPTILVKDHCIKSEEIKLLDSESSIQEMGDLQIDSSVNELDPLECNQKINENEKYQDNVRYDEIIQNELDEKSIANEKYKANLQIKPEEPTSQLNENSLVCMKAHKVLPENKAAVMCLDPLNLESTDQLTSSEPHSEIASSSNQRALDLNKIVSTHIEVKQGPKKVEPQKADQIKKQLDEPFNDSSKDIHQNKLQEKVEVIEPESKSKPKFKKDKNGEKVSKLNELENKISQNTATSSNDLTQHADRIDKNESKVVSKSNELVSNDLIKKSKDSKDSMNDKFDKGKVIKYENSSDLVESIKETKRNKSSSVDQNDVVEGIHSEKIPEKVGELSVKQKSLTAKPDSDKLVSVQLEIPFIGGALTWKIPVSVPSDKRRKSSSLKKDDSEDQVKLVTIKRKSSKELTNSGDVDTVFNLKAKSKSSKQETEAYAEATIETKVDQVDSLKSNQSIESNVNINSTTEKLHKIRSEPEENNILTESFDYEAVKSNSDRPSTNENKLKSQSPLSSTVSPTTLKTEGKLKSKRKSSIKKEKDSNVEANGQLTTEKMKTEVDFSVTKSLKTNTTCDTTIDNAFEPQISDKSVDHFMRYESDPYVTSTSRIEPKQAENIDNRSRRDSIPPMSPNRRERSVNKPVRRSLSRSRDRPNIPIASKGYNQMNERTTSIGSKRESIRSTYSEKPNESLRLFAESRRAEDRLSRFDSHKLHLPSSRSYLNLRRTYQSLDDIYHRMIDAVEDNYLRVKRTYDSIDSTRNQLNSFRDLDDEMKYKPIHLPKSNDYHSYIDHNRLVQSLDYSSHRCKKISSNDGYRRKHFDSDYSISTDYSSLFNSIRDQINRLKSDSRKRFRQIEFDYIYHSCPDITLLCSNQSFKRSSSSLSNKIRRRRSPEKFVSQSLEVNRYRSRPSNEASFIRRTTSSVNINGQSERVRTNGSTVRHNHEFKLSKYTSHYTSVQDLNYYTRRVEPKVESDKSKIYTNSLGPWFSNNNSISNHNYRPLRLPYSQIDQPIRRRESSSPPSFSSNDYDHCFKTKLNTNDHHSSWNLIYGNEDVYLRQSNKPSTTNAKREVSSIKYYYCNEKLNNLTVSRVLLDLTNSSRYLSNDLESKLVRARSNWAQTQSTIKAANDDKLLKNFSSNESPTLKKFIRRK